MTGLSILFVVLAGYLALTIGFGVAMLVMVVLDRRDLRRGVSERSSRADDSPPNPGCVSPPRPPAAHQARGAGALADATPSVPEWVNGPHARRRGDGPMCPVVYLDDHRRQRRPTGELA